MHDPGTIAAMEAAASTLLNQLQSELADRAHFPLDHPSRVDWAFYPTDHYGLSLNEIPPSLHRYIRELVRTGLSDATFARVGHIMSLEQVLYAREGNRELRDPGRYFVGIYGDPSLAGSWAWRFEGHHVSINVTIVGGRIASTTPLFLGANPAEIRSNRSASRPFADEEDAARDLLVTLDADQRDAAVLTDTAPIDIVTADVSLVPQLSHPGSPVHPIPAFQDQHESLSEFDQKALSLDLSKPKGVNSGQLDDSQNRLLQELVEVYLTRLPPLLAHDHRKRLTESSVPTLHFAWAGGRRRHDLHYYRIQGPGFLVEYDCVQDAGNHVHAVWRDPVKDFGNDLLGQHRRAQH
jgi:hypothetical protein